MAVEARDSTFLPASLAAPADTPFRIAFSNADPAMPHNVTITTGAGQMLLNKPPFNGVASVMYDVPALTAGTYRLGCIVHPGMTGTLTVR